MERKPYACAIQYCVTWQGYIYSLFKIHSVLIVAATFFDLIILNNTKRCVYHCGFYSLQTVHCVIMGDINLFTNSLVIGIFDKSVRDVIPLLSFRTPVVNVCDYALAVVSKIVLHLSTTFWNLFSWTAWRCYFRSGRRAETCLDCTETQQGADQVSPPLYGCRRHGYLVQGGKWNECCVRSHWCITRLCWNGNNLD